MVAWNRFNGFAVEHSSMDIFIFFFSLFAFVAVDVWSSRQIVCSQIASRATTATAIATATTMRDKLVVEYNYHYVMWICVRLPL